MGEAIARGHTDQQREGGRSTGHDQAVHEISREPFGVDDGGIVAPIETFRDENRRI